MDLQEMIRRRGNASAKLEEMKAAGNAAEVKRITKIIADMDKAIAFAKSQQPSEGGVLEEEVNTAGQTDTAGGLLDPDSGYEGTNTAPTADQQMFGALDDAHTSDAVLDNFKKFNEMKAEVTKGASTALVSAANTENQTGFVMNQITSDPDQFGSPLGRSKLIQTLAKNFGVTFGVDAGDIESVETLASQLRAQETGIVAQMRGQGVTFGAMSNAEWEKIAQQVGTVGNTLGGIYYIQGRLRRSSADIDKGFIDSFLDEFLN